MKSNYAIGVDLGGTSVKAGIISSKGKIVEKISLPSLSNEGPDIVITQIKKCINSLLEIGKYEIKGIGIGSPGLVILKKGTVENPPNFPGWESVHLGKIIKNEFGIKTFVENDANVAAVGEMIFGAGKKLNSFVMITLGTGVGGGLIINKELYRGESGGAGELGHITIDYSGRKCKCGSHGCLETYAGNNYMIESVYEDLVENPKSVINEMIEDDWANLNPKLIHDAALSGDEYAINFIAETGKALGYGLSSVVNLLDIPNIVVGGGVAGFGEFLLFPLKETLQASVMKPLRTKIRVNEAKLKNEAGIKGASALVFHKVKK